MSSAETAVAPSILDLINRTCELPTLPDVLVKLQAVMDDPDSSAEDVAQVIALDPSISTNILRIVNSAYYGLQVRVSSVNLAVSIMGFNMTKKVALKAAIFSAFGDKDRSSKIERFDPSAFWRHSIFTASLARAIGAESSIFQGVHPEDLYICGLLHDIGTIILCDSAPEAYSEILKRSAQEGVPVADLELEQLGYTHGDVGSVLAIKWFLPEDLTIAIRYHETPDNDPFHRALSSLVCLADRLAAGAGRPAVPGLPVHEVVPSLLEILELEEEKLEEIVQRAETDFAENGLPW
ncbi:MAG: HDOD domain-containing protein [Planctomycetes bacterium]|nr:HDOD domain-containing protein [Planctomycetota bacterium]